MRLTALITTIALLLPALATPTPQHDTPVARGWFENQLNSVKDCANKEWDLGRLTDCRRRCQSLVNANQEAPGPAVFGGTFKRANGQEVQQVNHVCSRLNDKIRIVSGWSHQ
ncbi:uncharacterized protein LOC62_07G009541 [Vanrija pseudolonga]|uniref:Uncharacterized protein n=1 Tax=Vanrija pseudolonga TaxID=143232 RepID=A0AAF1BMA6_9TREE|nr:hypothetical protein LOC62_07G009541 [Vanrija pseudolonga]